MSNIRNTFSGVDPVSLGNCAVGSTAMIRTLDVTTPVTGAKCKLSFNGTNADSVGGFFTGNVASVYGTASYSTGVPLRSGSMALDLTTNPSGGQATTALMCEVSGGFASSSTGMTITWWMNNTGSFGGPYVWYLDGSMVSAFYTNNPATSFTINHSQGGSLTIRNISLNTWYFGAYVCYTDGRAALYVVPYGALSVGNPSTPSSISLPTFYNVYIGAYSTWSSAFKGKIQDFRVYNRPLSTTELNSVLNGDRTIKMSSLYSRISDPTALVSFTQSHTDMVNKGFLTPTELYVGGAAANALVYAQSGLNLHQGNYAANLMTNSFNALAVPQTYVRYSVGAPYIGFPSTIMFWAKLPTAAITNASSANAATILTLSHGLNASDDAWIRVYVTSDAGTSHEVNADFYPSTIRNGTSRISGLTFGAWYCFGLQLKAVSTLTVRLYHAADKPVGTPNSYTNSYSDGSMITGTTTTPFTEVLIGRQYIANTGGFPGQIANFRVVQGIVNSFLSSTDWAYRHLNKRA